MVLPKHRAVIRGREVERRIPHRVAVIGAVSVGVVLLAAAAYGVVLAVLPTQILPIGSGTTTLSWHPTPRGSQTAGAPYVVSGTLGGHRLTGRSAVVPVTRTSGGKGFVVIPVNLSDFVLSGTLGGTSYTLRAKLDLALLVQGTSAAYSVSGSIGSVTVHAALRRDGANPLHFTLSGTVGTEHLRATVDVKTSRTVNHSAVVHYSVSA